MDTARLLRQALPALAHREAAAVLKAMTGAGAVEARGSYICLPGHVAAGRPGDVDLWRRLQPLYAQWQLQVPLLREVSARSGVGEVQLRDLLKRRAQAGTMVRVAPDRLLPREVLGQLADAVVRLSRECGENGFTIAAYRDFTAVGRNLAIEVLEFFDRLGLTQREGSGRVVRCLDASVATALRQPIPGALRFTPPRDKD
jgi:selenocysteine-specific elongation factor